jgi:hypothetical protein
MTSRQLRRIRREQERKQKKTEYKANRAAATATTPAPSLPAGVNPELLDEFTPEFLAYANAMRERISREVAMKMQNRPSSQDRGFVSQNDAAPDKRPTENPAKPNIERVDEPALQDEPASLSLAKIQYGEAKTRRDINRANAQHSTGPRTSTGKLASSRNSLKHGLASGTLIIPGEDPAAFDSLLESLLAEHQRANLTEEMLIHEMAQSFWLAQRALRFQNTCFTEDGVDEKRLALFLRYQTTHERAFHKALNALIRLQKDRRKLPRNNPIGFVSQEPFEVESESGFVSHQQSNSREICISAHGDLAKANRL